MQERIPTTVLPPTRRVAVLDAQQPDQHSKFLQVTRASHGFSILDTSKFKLMTSKFRADINALRALAVTLVVLFHFKFPHLEGGFIGVDIFFVISGYLMSKIILRDMQDHSFDYFAFLAMRIARIWPALVSLLILLLLAGTALLSPVDYLALSEQARAAILFYSNIFYDVGTGYFNAGPDERWLLHTWSLSVEWQFYMLYPLVLMLADQLRRRTSDAWASRHVFELTIAGLFLASLLISFLLVTRGANTTAFFSLQSRVWEMVAGGIVFLLESRAVVIPPKWNAPLFLVAILGLSATTWLAATQNWEARWPGGLAVLPVGFTALAMFAGRVLPMQLTGLMNLRPIRMIGLWSYSIYIWHWPLVVAINFVEPRGPALIYAKTFGIIGSVALGFLSYSLVEQNVRFRKAETILQRSVIVAVFGVVSLALFAQAAIRLDGLAFRASTDQAFYKSYTDLKSQRIFPESCSNFKKSRDELKICSINADFQGPRILMYGDSHAQHLYAWFKANPKIPIDFLTSSGCPPVPGYNLSRGGYFCNEFVDEALKRAGSEAYSTVIVAGNWDGVSGECAAATDGRCARPAGPAEWNDLVSANARAWSDLVRKGKRVVVIDQSPEADFNVMTTTMRRRFLGLTPIQTFVDSHPLIHNGNDYIAAVFARIPPEEMPKRIGLRSEFCEGVTCRIFDETTGLPLIIDQSHFAAGWIRQHGGALADAVK